MQTPEGPPPSAKFGPHKQANLPPLPFQAYAPPRPPEVVRAAYKFAAEHPEILSYVPCFCGCERAGHQGNDDCFVARRDASGDVVEWEPHGLDCTVCLDVANEAMQMYASGASVRDIRASIEKKWAAASAQSHTHTPTRCRLPPSDRDLGFGIRDSFWVSGFVLIWDLCPKTRVREVRGSRAGRSYSR